MELVAGVFSAFGLSASAGLNAYIPLLMVALLARYTDLLKLNPPWDTLSSPWVIGLLVILLLIEVIADKVPAVNHANDIIQTFVRPVAGAILFAASAQVLTDVHPVLSMISGVLVAGGVHTVKSVAIRPVVTATTGGAGNVPVSILEDVISTITSILAILIPIILGLILLGISIWIGRIFWKRSKNLQSVN